MLGINARAAALGIVVAMILVASAAHADTTFDASGQFSVVPANPGGDSVAGGVLTTGDGTLSLSYTDSGPGIASGALPSTFVKIGTLTLASNVTASQFSSGFDSGDQFQLTINQSSPMGMTSPASAATIDGTISFDSTTHNNVGVLTLHFAPNPVFISATDGNTYSYALHDTQITVGAGAPASSSGTLFADVSTSSVPSGTAAPLPATAGMGLALFGIAGIGMGLGRLRRKV